MTYPILNHNQEYSLDAQTLQRHRISPQNSLSSLPAYSDSYFSVILTHNRKFSVFRLPKSEILPPLNQRVHWPKVKIHALRIRLCSDGAGRSGIPELSDKYLFFIVDLNGPLCSVKVITTARN